MYIYVKFKTFALSTKVKFAFVHSSFVLECNNSLYDGSHLPKGDLVAGSVGKNPTFIA